MLTSSLNRCRQLRDARPRARAPAHAAVRHGAAARRGLPWRMTCGVTCVARTQHLYIERNFINPDFCPVVALLTWLKLTGIRNGALFPRLNSAHTSHIEGLAYVSTTYKEHLRLLFDYVQGPMSLASSHSVRKSCVAWATRCGVAEHVIVSAGRWKNNSGSFHDYVVHGLEIHSKLLGVDQLACDPVKGFWVFKTKAVKPLSTLA